MTADGVTIGNPVSRTYTYDWENRLTEIDYSGMVAQYKYDPFGRRIQKSVNGTITNYIYDGPNTIAEYDGNGNVRNVYLHNLAVDDSLALQQGGQIYFYHKDGLGSITQMTDVSANTTGTYRYNSFGEIISQTGNLNQPFAFTATEFDPESGLYYYRARYYDPRAGRFLTKDPVGLASGDVNLYRYVLNNPINEFDPWGLDSLYYDGGYLHWLNDQGIITQSYRAMSGPYGEGSLPSGDYTGSNLRTRTTQGMVCPSGGWSLDLEPNFSTDRTLLRIHPDQNPPGTAGCIGIDCSASQDLYNKLNNYLGSGNSNINLRVRYEY